MRLPSPTRLAAVCVVLAMPLGGLAAQPPAGVTERLRASLPADVAERVLARIADAREHALPAQALENRALKYASRGIDPAAIERAIGAHADRMLTAKGLLQGARTQGPAGDEVDAGAEALRQGVDGATISALAKSAPSGRSLAVPFFVLGGLVERGLPADSALARVRERLAARATDTELENLTNGRGANAGDRGNNGQTGLERATSMRPAGAGSAGGASGNASGVPQNGGKKVTPNTPKPPRPPRPPRP